MHEKARGAHILSLVCYLQDEESKQKRVAMGSAQSPGPTATAPVFDQKGQGILTSQSGE